MHNSKQGRFELNGKAMHTEQRNRSLPLTGNNWIVPGEFPAAVDRRWKDGKKSQGMARPSST